MRIASIYARVSSEQQREQNGDCEPDGGADWFPKGHDLEVRQDRVFEAEGIVERYWNHRALARAEPRRRRFEGSSAFLWFVIP